MASPRHLLIAGALLLAACTPPPRPVVTAHAPPVAVPMRPPAPQAESELDCLAKTIYFEARGESDRGQRAVAAVVLNRVRSPRFPDTVCEVVKQGGTASRNCQFSWWCDGRSDEPKDKAAWDKALAIARDMLNGAADPTGGALYFHRAGIRPGWHGELKRLAQIGAHVYYR
jgi:spore germination cell wall hydrolase CwlJ-like protein